MKISTISSNELKIFLTKAEALLLFGGLDKIDCENRQIKKILGFLIKDEEINKNFSANKGELKADIRLSNNGCTITLKKSPTEGIRVTKRYNRQKQIMLNPEASNELLSCLSLLRGADFKTGGISLYRHNFDYFLIVTFKEYKKHFGLLLREYSKQISSDKSRISYIEEHGKLISNDIRRLLFR